MKITVIKRFTLRKGYANGVLQKLAELQRSNPHHEYRIEHNDRADYRKYSLVRVSEVEIEVPDPPSAEEYPVPRNPQPKKLKPEEILFTIGEKDRWGHASTIARHIPSGTEAENAWGGKTEARKQLERSLDLRYVAKREAYNAAWKARKDADREWQQAVSALVEEATKAVVVA